MLIVIAVAGSAAIAVLAYNRVRDQDPDLATAAMRRVHQLAAVVVVITSGVEKLFDALDSGSRVRQRTSYVRPIWQSDFGDDE